MSILEIFEFFVFNALDDEINQQAQKNQKPNTIYKYYNFWHAILI